MRNKHYATYHISPNSADSSLPVWKHFGIRESMFCISNASSVSCIVWN
jgi:hypothetical protein